MPRRSRITEEERHERRVFLERRQAGIGGSDLPVILGLVRHRNAVDIYISKTRPVRDEDVEGPSIHQWRGHRFEAMAIEEYWRETGYRGRRVSGPVSHPDFPNVVVSPDFEIFADESREDPYKGTGVGEVKSPSAPVFRRIYENGLRDSELIQLQTNIAASRRSWGSFAYFNAESEDGPLLAVPQPADERLGAFLLEVGQRFWDECVVPRVSPDPDEWKLLASDDAPDIVEVGGDVETLETDGVFARSVAAMLDAKDVYKSAEENYRTKAAEIFEALRERGIGKARIPGLARLTVVTRDGRKTFDDRRLREHLPLDRDKVERWLRERIENTDATRTALSIEDVGRMLFETILDLDGFVNEGDPYQYLLPNRTSDE